MLRPAKKVRRGTAFQYCFFLDQTAQLDLKMQQPFFGYGLPFRRLVGALTEIGAERSQAIELMNQWDAVFKQQSSAWRQ